MGIGLSGGYISFAKRNTLLTVPGSPNAKPQVTVTVNGQTPGHTDTVAI